MAESPLPHKPSRKGKDREPSDLYERMIALQRRTATPLRTRERPEKPSARPSSPIQPISPPRKPPPPPPQVVLQRTASTDSPDDTQRRRKPASSSPRVHHAPPHSMKSQGKLFNPDVDPIPMRRTAEPELLSDTGSSSYAPRNGPLSQDRGTHHGRLFDHKKDDPVRFSVLARPGPANGNRPAPTPKSSGEYVSASSTSSYAHSITSSNFTLSSTTDGSSASSAVFDQQHREHANPGAFAAQLKKLYRQITSLEAKLIKDESKDAPEDVRIAMKRPKGISEAETEDLEREKWQKFVADHKHLAEQMHTLLRLTLAPHVPASLRNIPTKYNIIIRLWLNAFNRPLETLRRAMFQSQAAFEQLQDFSIFAYTFYTMLWEEPTLDTFKLGWIEALGDLARYRMAIAAVTAPPNALPATGDFTPVNEATLAAQTQPEMSDARIDDSLGPSVGVAAARSLELEPEKERWRCIARQWYASGLTDTPGTGKLHHHLGLLSREVEGEELRAVYHFVKSMTTLHPFPTSRESILPIWSPQAQARRSQPDASAADLFVLLHGMLFTNIQLDDFLPTLSRFMERLQFEDTEESAWIMMAIINIASILEYGRHSGVLRSTGGIGNVSGASGKDTSTASQAASASAKVSMMVKKLDEMEVDDHELNGNPATVEQHNEPELEPKMEIEMKVNGVINVSPIMMQAQPVPGFNENAQPPLVFKYALQLTFEMLAYTLRNPRRADSPFARKTLNPYNTIILTFIVTVLKHQAIQKALERAFPWQVCVDFFGKIPRKIIPYAEGGVRLTANTSPLPEDWCLRGMEWVGRKVYERGFWKSDSEGNVEMEVLSKSEDGLGDTDGIIEDDCDESDAEGDGIGDKARWVRIVRAAAGIAKTVPGFTWEMGTRNWSISGELHEKVKQWEEEERLEREADARRRSRKAWNDDDMEVDTEEDAFMVDLSEDSGDDSEDNDEIKLLKARRRELQLMLQSSRLGSLPKPRSRLPKATMRAPEKLSPLRVVPGHTVLVVDTNILLSSLVIFAGLVESLHWTIIVPLAVITELDGIASNSSQLGEAAKNAVSYITSHLRSHSLSLKVQTSRGNYLSSLNVRSELLEFPSDSWERNMDDLILRAAIWQDDHWVDRSAMLGSTAQNITGAAKVVLLSFDRNLRLKARARQLDAADEKEMATILKAGS